MNMVGFKDNFQTKTTNTPPGHLKQSYSASLELSILETLPNPHYKMEYDGQISSCRSTATGTTTSLSYKLQSQAAATLFVF